MARTTHTWPDAPKGRTRREIIALRHSLTVQRGWGSKRSEVTDGIARQLANRLPLPVFDAGPKNAE